jgi:hypothetical protein
MPYLQCLNAGLLGVARLQLRHHLARLVAQSASLVEGCFVAAANEPAIALEQREFVRERGHDLPHNRLIGREQRAEYVVQLRTFPWQFSEPRSDARRRPNPVTNGGEVARPAAADHETGQRARHVRRDVQKLAGLLPGQRVADENLDGVEPVRDRLGLGQGRGEPLREEPRARRCHRAVDGGEQRAAPFAAECPHQFEVRARRLID